MDFLLSFIGISILVVVVLLLLTSCVKIVPQAQALVVERLGAYLDTWSVGVHFKMPFIDRVAKRVILKEQVVDFAPQPVITKDNVTMKIDTVVFFQITDPKLYAYGVENPIMAIENLTAQKHHRRPGVRPDPDLQGDHQHKNARSPGRGHRSLGYQGKPGGA